MTTINNAAIIKIYIRVMGGEAIEEGKGRLERTADGVPFSTNGTNRLIPHTREHGQYRSRRARDRTSLVVISRTILNGPGLEIQSRNQKGIAGRAPFVPCRI